MFCITVHEFFVIYLSLYRFTINFGNEMTMKKRVPDVGTLLIRYYLKICSATESTGKPMDVVASLPAASTMPSAMM